MRGWRLLLVILALLALLTQPVRADDDDDDDGGADAGGGSPAGGGDGAALPDTEAVARSAEIEAGPDKPAAGDKGDASADGDGKGDDKDTFLQGSKPRFTMTSITPAHGPVTGDTRVTVRGAGLEHLAAAFPEPKCRFGSDAMIVTGAYVSCPPVARGPWDKEAKKRDRTATCI